MSQRPRECRCNVVNDLRREQPCFIPERMDNSNRIDIAVRNKNRRRLVTHRSKLATIDCHILRLLTTRSQRNGLLLAMLVITELETQRLVRLGHPDHQVHLRGAEPAATRLAGNLARVRNFLEHGQAPLRVYQRDDWSNSAITSSSVGFGLARPLITTSGA